MKNIILIKVSHQFGSKTIVRIIRNIFPKILNFGDLIEVLDHEWPKNKL